MKKGLLASLFITTLVLAGCQSNSNSGTGGIKNGTSIYSTSVRSCSSIELKAQSVEYMINNKYSFHLLTYTEECSYCTTAKENAEEIVKWSGFAIYKIEMYEGSINYLSTAFPSYFTSNDSYPSLLTFKDGELTFKSKINDITDLASFRRYINANTYKVNINTVINKEGYEYFSTIPSCKYLLYVYDSTKKDGKDIFFKSVFPYAYKAFNATLIIDISLANVELIEEIRKDYDLSDSDDFDILSAHYQDDTKTTLRYFQESDSNIDNLLSSFFNVYSINGSSQG